LLQDSPKTSGRQIPTDELIALNSLVKKYGTTRALDNVEFVVNAGITGLLGPNGAGKSTLIKVILGLVRVTSGWGKVMGYDWGPRAERFAN
jgi:ABC-2 type transport system ATP-binding protein